MISRKHSNDTIYKRYHSFQLANRKFVPRPRLKSSFLRADVPRVAPPGIVFLDLLLVFPNLVRRVFLFSNMAVENEKTLGTMLLFFLLSTWRWWWFFLCKKWRNLSRVMRRNQLYFPMLSPKSSEVWVEPGAGVEIYLFNLILIHVFFYCIQYSKYTDTG